MIAILILVAAWWFLWKKTYYVRIESVGNDLPTMEQVLKIELETTLRQAIAMTTKNPYLVASGNYFAAKNLVKIIAAHGGVAKITFHWAWKTPEEGPIKA